MKAVTILTIVTVTGLLGITAVHASNNESSYGKIQNSKFDSLSKQRRAKMKEIFKELNLTPKQQEQMKALRQEMRVEHQKRKAEMRKANGMVRIRPYISSNGFDKQGFIAMSTQRSQMMIRKRADMFEKQIAILTPEQRLKLLSLMQEK